VQRQKTWNDLKEEDRSMRLIAHFAKFASVLAGLLATVALCDGPRLAGAEEIREYEVSVRQKPVGKVTTRIKYTNDGTTVATTDTVVDATFFLIKYHYDFHGTETWAEQEKAPRRLIQLDSRTNDDGKALAVTAVSDGSGSRIDVRGSATRRAPALVMTSNYWHAPDARLTANQFSIVDADTGALFAVRMQRLGTENVAVQGQNIPCVHCRVSGDTAADIWFDGNGRLVRQETVEQGYVTELLLVRVQGSAKAE
jgi:uncharacterized protein DUF6134